MAAPLRKSPHQDADKKTKDAERVLARFKGMTLEIAGKPGSEIRGRLVQDERERSPEATRGQTPSLKGRKS